MVGGGAYYAGKKSQERGEREADQEDRLQQLEAQQSAQQPAPAPAAARGMTDDTIEQLKKLGELRDSGVLTDEEFEAQKQKLLGG